MTVKINNNLQYLFMRILLSTHMPYLIGVHIPFILTREPHKDLDRMLFTLTMGAGSRNMGPEKKIGIQGFREKNLLRGR